MLILQLIVTRTIIPQMFLKISIINKDILTIKSNGFYELFCKCWKFCVFVKLINFLR